MSLHEIRVERNIRIPTADPSLTLSADLYMPVAVQSAPALISIYPYRKDGLAGIENDENLRWLASQGYACLLVDFRGTGSSDGAQRPPFDAGEAEDAIAAIEWAYHQSWCSGRVGMWGISYGAIMTLRAAASQPAHLTAILPIMGSLDPERQFVHPAGSTGCFTSLGQWATQTLLFQLLPPLGNHDLANEQRRWRQRIQYTEPWLLDLSRHGPGHPVWRSRTIDATKIVVPSFCIAGWRDLFCEGTIRAYESISSPKKLLVGPWMHTFPDQSPFAAIEFRRMTLRWWDFWLKGIDTGVMDEQPVTLFAQGARSHWRTFHSWPLEGRKLLLATTSDNVLRSVPSEVPQSSTSDSVAIKWTTDATVGSLSGLWGATTSGFGLPLDQHDDDVRSIAFTSLIVESDILIVGRPIIRVHWTEEGGPGRLVVRLTDVNQDGCSTLITMGMLTAPNPAGGHEVTLNPTCYRVPQGHRLRVVLGNADFPRLWPAEPSETEAHGTLTIGEVELEILQTSDGYGTPTTLSIPEDSPDKYAPLVLRLNPLWTITRSPMEDSVEISVGHNVTAHSANRNHILQMEDRMTAKVSRHEPNAAKAFGSAEWTIRMNTGETVVVRVETQMCRTWTRASASVTVDSKTIFAREWDG